MITTAVITTLPIYITQITLVLTALFAEIFNNKKEFLLNLIPFYFAIYLIRKFKRLK